MCEVEAFRDERSLSQQPGVSLLGVSTDSLESHRQFAARHALTFPLVADTAGRLAAAFGVDTSGGFARRATFVIDRRGHVARVFPQVDPHAHAAEVLAAVRETAATP